MRFEVLIIRGRDHFRFDGALEISDFLGPLVNQEHENLNLRMVGRDRIGDLLEDGGFAGARRGHDQTTGAFAERCHQIDDARLE